MAKSVTLPLNGLMPTHLLSSGSVANGHLDTKLVSARVQKCVCVWEDIEQSASLPQYKFSRL
eukprot:180430-Amphidinium_carterae.1